jgi:tetratricopeptide (TPR) repeat protein
MSRVHHTRALAHWFAGRCADASEAWTQAAAHARRSRHPWALPDIQAWIASSLQLGPEPVPSAIERCEALREETENHPLWQAFILRPLGLLYALHGDLARADATFETCGQALAEFGETIHSAAKHREAEGALLAGDPARAEALLRDSLERLQAMGDRSLVSVALPLLAQAVEQQGRADEAYALSLRSEEQASRLDILAQVHWRTVRARVLARREQHEDAERLAREAQTLADSTDWLLGRGGARETLAAVLAAAGREEDAYQARSDAISLYERKGARLLSARDPF